MKYGASQLSGSGKFHLYRSTHTLFFILFLVFIFCLGVAGHISAEEKHDHKQTFELDPVVVSADKMESEIYKMPSNVSVITKEEIEKYAARDITDLLKQVPGLKIFGLGYGVPGIGFYSTRGSEPDIRGVKIMVNGIDWSKGSGMFSPPRVPIDAIERIEVIKTPSAMYGDQGSGGVINIITRVSDNPIEAEAGLSFGSYGSEKYYSVVSGTQNKLEYLFDVSLTKFDGYQQNAWHNATNLFTRLRYYLDDDSFLTFNGLMLDMSCNYPGSLTREQFDADPRQNPAVVGDTEADSWIAALEYDKSVGSFSMKAKLAVNGDDSEGFGSTTLTRYDEFAVWPELTVTWFHDIGNMKNKLVGGAEYRNYTMDTLKHAHTNGAVGEVTSDREREDDVWGAYIQDELQITDEFTVTAGLRYDAFELTSNDSVDSSGNFDSSDSAWSPKLGATYSFSRSLNLFAGYNSGFKSVVRGVTTGAINSNLKPELVHSYEVGLRGQPSPWIDYNAALFRIDTTDKIIRISDDPATYDNAGETRAEGIEMGIKVNFDNGIYGALNYTFQDSEYVEYRVGSAVYNGNRLPRVSEHLIGTSIGYRNDFFGDFRFWANYYSDKYLDSANAVEWPDYWLLNAKYTKRITFIKPHLEFYISGENLADKQYVECGYSASALYPSMGRSIMFGLKAFF